MPRRRGWDYAQLKSDFLSDPEFMALRDVCASGLEFRAAVGEWAIALAHSWREDTEQAPESAYEDLRARLASARLIDAEGRLRGFDKWTGSVRTTRDADAARKRRTRAESGDVRRTPVDPHAGEGEGEVEEEERSLDRGSSRRARAQRPPADGSERTAVA